MKIEGQKPFFDKLEEIIEVNTLSQTENTKDLSKKLDETKQSIFKKTQGIEK